MGRQGPDQRSRTGQRRRVNCGGRRVSTRRCSEEAHVVQRGPQGLGSGRGRAGSSGAAGWGWGCAGAAAAPWSSGHRSAERPCSAGGQARQVRAGCTPPCPAPPWGPPSPFATPEPRVGTSPSASLRSPLASEAPSGRHLRRPDVTAHEPRPKRLGRFHVAQGGAQIPDPTHQQPGHACPQVLELPAPTRNWRSAPTTHALQASKPLSHLKSLRSST